MRVRSLWSFCAALACAAFLVACGGGGGSGSTPSAGGGLTVPGSVKRVGTTVTIKYTRHSGFKPKAVSRRSAKSVRSPKYISGDAQGLQVTVSATGVASQTVYADITGSLCTNVGSTYTCTITVPTLSANEQFSFIETDTVPQNENPSGYGTAFPSNSNILAASNSAEAITLGAANNIAIELNPVMGGGFYDCTGGYAFYGPGTPAAGVPSTQSANFGEDPSGYNFGSDADNESNSGGRIVVTGGVASLGSLGVVPLDAAGDCAGQGDTTPAAFVDVNATPVPVTVTSNSSAVTLSVIPNAATAPPTASYLQSASIANDGFVWQPPAAPPFLFIAVNASASFSSTSGTIVLNNNLSADNPFFTTPSTYAETMTFTVVPITVSPTSATVSAAGGTATVTGTDPGAYFGMDAESSYTANNGSYWWSAGGGDENCNSSGGTTLATVSAPAGINTTNWTQAFTITGANNGTGTCTFYLFDYNALTITHAVTVTVN